MSSGASMLLGPATVGFLRDAGQEVAFSAEEVIIRRGDHQDFFYVVIEGQVELLLNEGESRKRPLARLGEGGIFGAESVLAKEGAAIDAVAVTDVRLLRYPASALPSALQESASLRKKLLGGFARNLHKTTSDALDLLHGADVMARLVQGDNDPDELIAVSPRMKAIQKKVVDLAGLEFAGSHRRRGRNRQDPDRPPDPRRIGSIEGSADRGQLPRPVAGPRGRAHPRRRPRRPAPDRRPLERRHPPRPRRHPGAARRELARARRATDARRLYQRPRPESSGEFP